MLRAERELARRHFAPRSAESASPDFDRAILTALRAQSDALSGIPPKTEDETAALWGIAARFERIALRVVAARSAYFASLSCGSPTSQLDAALELMAEAVREVRIVEQTLGDTGSGLSEAARSSLSRPTRSLERDLAIESSQLGESVACRRNLKTGKCEGTCAKGKSR